MKGSTMKTIRSHFGTVFIAGAGPGDPDLLTVKAMRVLQRAEVLLYDRLVHQEVLNYAPDTCEMIYVGKQDGKHLVPQERINELLLEAATRAEVVVRLKGGDPFLFGRGGEEALFLANYGVPFEIIPGVTSALSVPAYAGIPVTHRGMTSHCTVITGHLSAKRPEEIPWASLNHKGTLLFLMSVGPRQTIAQQLIEHGRPAQEPVAFIEQGTTSEQKVWVSTLQQVALAPPPVKSPAIMVVGEVVRLREKIKWFLPEIPADWEHQASSLSTPSLFPMPVIPEDARQRTLKTLSSPA